MKIETGRFHTKTKHKMLEFIRLSVLHKSSKTAAEYFIREYSETELKKAQKAAETATKDYENARNLAGTYAAGAYVSAITEMGNAQAKLASLSDLPEAYRSPIFLRNEVKRLFAAVTAWEEALKALQEKKEPLLSALGGAEANFQNATAQREKLAADYKAQSDALDEKARRAGFADRNDCKVWCARVKEEERMEKSISDYETELKATEKTIADERLVTGGSKRPDMAALGQEDNQLQHRLTTSAGQSRSLADQLDEEARTIGAAFDTPDAQARIRAFASRSAKRSE